VVFQDDKIGFVNKEAWFLSHQIQCSLNDKTCFADAAWTGHGQPAVKMHNFSYFPPLKIAYYSQGRGGEASVIAEL